QLRIDRLGSFPRHLGARLGEHLDRLLVERVAGVGPGRMHLDRAAGAVAQESSGHLGLAAVLDADEQDAGLAGHEWSPVLEPFGTVGSLRKSRGPSQSAR